LRPPSSPTTVWRLVCGFCSSGQRFACGFLQIRWLVENLIDYFQQNDKKDLRRGLYLPLRHGVTGDEG